MSIETLNCLRCGEAMQFLAHERLQLGQTGWILGDIPNLLAGALEVHIYRCPNCSKLEFFAADGEPTKEEEPLDELPQRTCPECGTIHDFDYPKCPRCNHDYYAE